MSHPLPASQLAHFAEEALLLSVVIALPVVGIAALIGLITAVFQATTQLSDQTLAHLPRIIGVSIGLLVFGPWMGRELVAFATKMLTYR
jgi:flagellar biosynthesis protein FliQ